MNLTKMRMIFENVLWKVFIYSIVFFVLFIGSTIIMLCDSNESTDKMIESIAESIKVGMSKDSITILLGKPHKVLPGNFITERIRPNATNLVRGGKSIKVKDSCFVYDHGFMDIWIYFDYSERVEYVTIINTN